MRKLAPLAALVALTVGLTGCTLSAPSPTPTATPSASPTAEAPSLGDPTAAPTTVDALPGSALLRVSVTAQTETSSVRLELTFSRAQVGTNAREAFAAIQEACPNSIASQLDVYPGLEPTGVIVSELSMIGDWADGMTVAVAAGGLIASFGEGRSVAEAQDGDFGCTVPIVTGPGNAEFTSLLIGDPAITDRIDLENQIAHGIFGFEADSGSAVEVRWVDCVIQLSSTAQRIATEYGWTLPSGWGNGCLIGDGGTV